MDKLVSFRRLLCWLLPYWRGYGWHAAINAAMGILTVVLNLGFVAGTRLTIDIATGVTQRFTLNTALLLLGAIMVYRSWSALLIDGSKPCSACERRTRCKRECIATS